MFRPAFAQKEIIKLSRTITKKHLECFKSLKSPGYVVVRLTILVWSVFVPLGSF